MTKIVAAFCLLLAAHACGNNVEQKQNTMPTQQEVNKSMEEVNRKMALDERIMIDGYIERRGWEMMETGTGLRYMIYEQGEGELAMSGQRAMVNYRVSLLDGTEVYTSDDNGAKEFQIGQDNVESGLHEGMLFMKPGDKAMFILPSHLAHGLTGDNNKIPPRSSVVYDIELLSVK